MANMGLVASDVRLMKVALKQGLFVPVSISDIKDISALAALFEVDSNYGRWTEDVRAKDSCFVIGDREIPYFDSVKGLARLLATGGRPVGGFPLFPTARKPTAER